MKYLLLIPFLSFAQHRAPEPFVTKYNEPIHFYSSCLTNDVFYSTQGLIWKEWKPSIKLLISNAMTLATITAKELYDSKKCRPTGFDKMDFFIGFWAMLIYTIVRICINDLRKHDRRPN